MRPVHAWTRIGGGLWRHSLRAYVCHLQRCDAPFVHRETTDATLETRGTTTHVATDSKIGAGGAFRPGVENPTRSVHRVGVGPISSVGV